MNHPSEISKHPARTKRCSEISKTMKLFVTFLALLCIDIVHGQQPIDSRNRDIVFKNVNVIAMDSDRVLTNKTVVTRNGKIVSITDGAKAKIAANAFVVEASDKYLMPGLSEMHAHVPPIDDIEPMKNVLMLFALNGVTTIRGMLGHPRHLELRSKIKSGEILGPHFYTSGPSFNGSTVKTKEEGAARVIEQKKAGYDFLKIHPGLTLENFNAVARTAKAENIPFAGHVPYAVGVWRAIDAGYATIDHLDGFVESLVPGLDSIPENRTGLFATFIGYRADTSRIKTLITGLRNRRIYVVPTQALAERWIAPGADADMLASAPEMVYMDEQTVNDWVKSKKSLVSNPSYNPDRVNEFLKIRRQLIAACNHGGVGLLLGSDGPQVFNVPGFSVHHELRYLVDAGLTPFEAIKTGTVNVGQFYNDPLQGTIKAGAPSDLILLNGNPLVDIDQTKNIHGVMIGSKYMNHEFIDAGLKKLKKR
ncbi:amidohydrolase family protein [Flavitalea sp.]|nr:amidohydrolase family protein [Flavitalea sp.]